MTNDAQHEIRSPSGFNILLMGPPGTGKTHAIRTLVDAGIETFCIFTEPGYATILGDLPSDKLHWHYIPAAAEGWAALEEKARKITALSFDSLSKMSATNKQDYNQLMELITACNNFPDDRTGDRYGDVSTWDTSRALVIDSLSGINIMAQKMLIGGKPTMAPGEWGVSMNMINDLITGFTMRTRCHFVLTAHVEQELDEVGGGRRIMVSTLGRKLAPVIPRFFDDVVYTWTEEQTFYWSNIHANVEAKRRILEFGDKHPPDFAPLIDRWRHATGASASPELAAEGSR